MKKIISIILIISISLTVLITALENNAYNKNFYIEQFWRNNTEEETGKSMDKLSIIAQSLIDYLKGKGFDELLLPYFNEKEVAHMRDVQDLFDMARALKYISAVVAIVSMVYLALKYDKQTLGRIILFGLFSNHILVIALGLLIATDFTKYWTIFHHIFFTNDLWLLNPATDLMIQMLPEQFFSSMAINIMLSFFIYLGIIQLMGLYYMKRGNKNEKIFKKHLSGKKR